MQDLKRIILLTGATSLLTACLGTSTPVGEDSPTVQFRDGACADGGACVGAATRYEAEARDAQSGCRVRSNHGGFTGTGFVDFGGNGSFIEWRRVEAPLAGLYRLDVRYANARSAARPADVIVNGARAATLGFGRSGTSWSSWRVDSVTVRLREGTNTVRLRASSGAGGPNVDHVVVTAEDLCPDDGGKVEPGQCGCGTPDRDQDGDGVADCQDGCPTDADKQAPGECGCGVPEGRCGGAPGEPAQYEAEDRAAEFGCSERSNHAGFTGDGFMDFGGNGSWIEWRDVSAAAPGDYTLAFRYANAGSGPRAATVLINGAAAAQVPFAGTGDAWSDWGTASVTVALRRGPNTVRVMASTGAGGPNLDHMRVTFAGGAPGDDAPGDACPDDPAKIEPGECGCGVPEGSCGGGGDGAAILLPIEVMGPSGTQERVRFELDGPVDDITHLVLTCHACGYNDHALDSDPDMVKAAVQINGGPRVALKRYTRPDGGGVVGNRAIQLLSDDDEAYGGIGGGFRTNSLVVPVSGLRRGVNELTFTHVDADRASIGFRIVAFNFLRGAGDGAPVLPDERFAMDDPNDWSPEKALGTTDPAAVAEGIRRGRALWTRNDHLYDPGLDALDGVVRGGPRPLNGEISASCADCHAADGRDLAYFNFSDHSIIERAVFHGLSHEEGRQIAAYIRSLDVPVVEAARPWNPPYQPGPGMDARPVHEWAAGAGLGAVLDADADMAPFLFPRGTSGQAVRDVVDRFGTLNMRELPIALQLPDWNQWLPTVHPKDGFDTSAAAIRQDKDGRSVGGPYWDVLYEKARSNPTARNLGDLIERLEKWFSRGGTCYTQSVTKGPGWRATNSLVAQAVKLGDGVPGGIGADQCKRVRHDQRLGRPLELAKRGLIAWTSVKLWELHHGTDRETAGARLTDPVCAGDRCVDASEARGWFTLDRHEKGMTVFNRAPHYVGHNSRYFIHQAEVVGHYESTAWYHLQMVLNPGYRRAAPSHFPYTQVFIENLQRTSGVNQSYRFWASLIKQRQTQTNGRYGVEDGLDLRTAQPFIYYSDKRGNTSVRAGVGRTLWRRLMEAMLIDLVEDAANATQAAWDAASGLSSVQDRDSRNFSSCDRCFQSNANPMPFEDHKLQGLNTARLIPKLREVGVSESVVGRVLDWCEDMWPFGPWRSLRNP